MSYSPWLAGPDGQQWKLDAEKLVLGREAACDLAFDLPRLSRQHAVITRLERVYYLGDLNSRNGTFVNGQALSGVAVRLKDGDEIVLGGVLTLRYHDPGETVEGPRLGKLRGVWIDEAARVVWVDAKPVEPPLSAAQFTLLQLLYADSGRVVTRAQLIAAVWPEADPAGVSEEAVDGLIKRLRARLRDTAGVDYLEILRGQGLRLKPATD
jgi:predicted component of type VI protein secretion system